ncbi:MAG: hypothetical protein N3A66_04320, partial [Planctomycetota bacterium]|nr:hypothetical protein [Planctomycetota bacterium]
MSSSRVAIIAYNMIDGACAAAMALPKEPKADILISSASAIGYRLQMIAEERKKYETIHICGLGARSPWEETNRGAAALRKKGTKIIWYCGRGYL